MSGAARPALGTAHRELPSPASCPCLHRGKLRHGGCREIRAEPGACSLSQNVTFPSPGPTERAASMGGGGGETRTSPHGLSPAPPRCTSWGRSRSFQQSQSQPGKRHPLSFSSGPEQFALCVAEIGQQRAGPGKLAAHGGQGSCYGAAMGFKINLLPCSVPGRGCPAWPLTAR